VTIRSTKANWRQTHGLLPRAFPLLNVFIGRFPKEFAGNIVENKRPLAILDYRAIGAPHAHAKVDADGVLNGPIETAGISTRNYRFRRAWSGKNAVFMPNGLFVCVLGGRPVVNEVAAAGETSF
jgi:hypothetical protein